MGKPQSQLSLGPLEVKRSDHEPTRRSDAVKELDRVPLEMARARVGAAFSRGIGDASLKAYGDPGLIRKVVTGEKVPDYLARIAQDADARRRFAMALLEDDSGVVITTTITIAQKKSA